MTASAPSSTYRLQISADFTLADATEIVGYLADLGVGAIYLSPLLASTTGSGHGYDTVDVTLVDPSRGGEQAWQALLTASREAGLEVIVDIVPNHLGISVPFENPAWWDVLKHGQASAYAHWFDIDWTRGRLVVPILGDDATLEVVGDELHYFEHRFPLAPGTHAAGDGAPGDNAADVHDRQHYELVHFRRGNAELNYRRFFAVTTLAGVRVEDESVFDATHAEIGRWVGQGVAGLRVDHPDGLVDPGEYLTRLRALAPEAWITVEKILEPGEVLPADWPVAGTTGYDAMREVNGLFIDPAGETPFTALYQRLTGDERTLTEHIETGKRMVTTDLLPAEVSRMAALVPEVDQAGRAIAEIAVAFHVYRSYLPAGAEDLDAAIALATSRNPGLVDAIDALSPRLHDHTDELARRMQQLSGATMAKGIEDTAYYRYSRFVGLNEVGGNPDDFGIAPADFHAAQVTRQATQPESMTSLSTHDTKRGEDVRARLAVLSEIPTEWTAFAEQVLATSCIPNLAFAYFVAQTLVGVGPVERERLHAYVEKAMREANDGTGWVDQDEAFETAVHDLVDAVYDRPALRAAWDEIVTLVEAAGWSNALGQKIVQLTMPGVPDVYQGTEIWEDSLVDPDNRRPVDYASLWSLLAASAAPAMAADGAAKQWIVTQVLRFRRDHAEALSDYRPPSVDTRSVDTLSAVNPSVDNLSVEGSAADHLVAYDRGGVVTLATRLPLALAAAGGWGDTTVTLPRPVFDALTGAEHDGVVRVRDVLSAYPVALLADR